MNHLKLFLIAAVLLLISNSSFGQSSSNPYAPAISMYDTAQYNKKYIRATENFNYGDGMVVTKDSAEVISGAIIYPFYNKFDKVKVVTKEGEVYKFNVHQIEGFRKDFNSYQSINSSLYEIEYLGTKASLYSQISYASMSIPTASFGATGVMTPSHTISKEVNSFLIVKSDGTMLESQALSKSSKKRLVNFFSGCPELAAKILAKEFDVDDLKSIVIQYNDCD